MNLGKKNLFCGTLMIAYLVSGCQSSSNVAWEETKTLGRYLQRSGKLLLKKDADSRLIHDASEIVGPREEEYIPLRSEDLKIQTVDNAIPQPKEDPGQFGGSVPGVQFFKEPSGELASIFKRVYFETDKHIVTERMDMETVERIASYLKNHKGTYVFVTGHCDERASEAYNLALGTRRANSIRQLLVKQGIDPNRIYTVSYGKEMPIDGRHTKEAWAKNRRVEFKIYDVMK